jgi:hypothetical protein
MLGKFLHRHVLSFAALLVLLPLRAGADFRLEFTDGSHVTVRQYVEDKETIVVYTQHGTIGFRKADIRKILEVDAADTGTVPLDTLSEQRSSGSENSEQSSFHQTQATPKSGKGAAVNQDTPTKAGVGAEPALGQLKKKYANTAGEIDTLWEKHLHDVDSGASQETLAENRRQLDVLGQKRHTLLKAVREVTPQDLPDWAR